VHDASSLPKGVLQMSDRSSASIAAATDRIAAPRTATPAAGPAGGVPASAAAPTTAVTARRRAVAYLERRRAALRSELDARR
jgi:hypothetical protein